MALVGVTKQIITEGNGADFPKKGDKVLMHYTGWNYDPSLPGGKRQPHFDSSIDRGDPLSTNIGVRHVIQGWDEGIIGTDTTPGMSLGEKANLLISSEYGYGSRGYPGAIPPNSDLIFEVQLVGINDKRI